jgi:hypothetical protein
MAPGRNKKYSCAMYGYIFAILLGLFLLSIVVATLGSAQPTASNQKKLPRNLKPLQNDAPAADEPTPDRSSISTPRQREAARHHTPPA